MKKLLMIFILFTFSALFGQNVDSVKSYELKEISVVSSVRANENTPVTEKTYDKKDLETIYYGQEVPDVLSYTPSMTTYSDMGNGFGYSYFRLRGIDQTRINVTLDGVPLNEPEDQGVYFNNYPGFLSSVESMQIQRGVGTSTNGVASYGGSINFNTISLSNNFFDIEYLYGSYNTNKWSIGYSSGINKLSNNTSGGLYLRYTSQTTDGYRNHSWHDGQSIFLNGELFFDNSMLKYTFFYGNQRNDMVYLATSKSDLKIDRKMNYLEFNPYDEEDHFEYVFNSLQYYNDLGNNWSNMVTLYYIRLVGNYDVWWEENLNFNLDSDFIGLITNAGYSTKNFTFDAGVHFNTYQRNHWLYLQSINDNAYYNSGKKDEVSTFIKSSYSFDRLTLYGDVQLRYTNFEYIPDVNAEIGNSKWDWTFFNPKVGLIFNISDNVNAYTTFGITHREPTRNDLFNGEDDINVSNIGDVIKSDIKPEKVINQEMGIEMSTKDLHARINIFNMDFEDEIAAIGQLSYIGLPLRKNVESSNRQGVEIDFSVKFNNLVITNAFTYNHSNIDKYVTEYDGKVYEDVEALLTPNIMNNTSVTLSLFNKLDVTVFGRYIGESYLDNENTLKLPSSFIVDVSHRFITGKYFTVLFRINNAFNSDSYSSGYIVDNEEHFYPLAMRNYLLSLKLTL